MAVDGFSRRGVLGLGALAAAGLVVPRGLARGLGQSVAAPGGGAGGGRTRVIRIAHVTDTHIMQDLRAPEGVAACFEHIRGQKDVDLVMHGGDIVFDSMDQSLERSKELWALWQKVMGDSWKGKVRYCLGNHDIWGWNKNRSKTTGEEPGWGKQLALDTLGVQGAVPKGAYYSFDEVGNGGGWHIVVLDTVRPEPNGYYAGLDDEQFEWLKGDLSLNRMHPTLILSHIPIFSATVLDRDLNDKRERLVHPALMCIDYGRIKKLFLENPQVKVCLSGHMHLIDRVEYNGVAYCCNGAACAAWWKGPHKECREGYTLVDLYSDGTFENRYVEYGWKAAQG
ncbi:MAG TPA: metallophosphoesterase [Phycisphaerales bacterium]|nr:metallophosphoesterase [Phycisphaerales bacterium]